MKIITSYFYQIRNFTPNIIPISTAMWDPKWYHDFKGKGYTFLDKNMVVNGLRYEPFVPGESCYGLCNGLQECKEIGTGKCKFLDEYLKQLESLDFNQTIKDLELIARKNAYTCPSERDLTLALMFFETPNNPCSERVKIMEWFGKNGLELSEFIPKKTIKR